MCITRPQWVNFLRHILNLERPHVCGLLVLFLIWVFSWSLWMAISHKVQGVQYHLKYLFVRTCNASKPWDLHLDLSDHSDIWQVSQQHCCWSVCQISKWYDDFNYQSCSFEASRHFTRMIDDVILKQTPKTLIWGLIINAFALRISVFHFGYIPNN